METESIIAIAGALTAIAGVFAIVLKRRSASQSDPQPSNVIQMPTITIDRAELDELIRKVEAISTMAAQVGRIVEMSDAILDKAKEHHWKTDAQAELMAKALEKIASALEDIKENTRLMAHDLNK